MDAHVVAATLMLLVLVVPMAAWYLRRAAAIREARRARQAGTPTPAEVEAYTRTREFQHVWLACYAGDPRAHSPAYRRQRLDLARTMLVNATRLQAARLP